MDNENLIDLVSKLNRLQERARYLQGKRKGAWGVTTDADGKRAAEIQNLEEKINRIKYNCSHGENSLCAKCSTIPII